MRVEVLISVGVFFFGARFRVGGGKWWTSLVCRTRLTLTGARLHKENVGTGTDGDQDNDGKDLELRAADLRRGRWTLRVFVGVGAVRG